MDTREINRLERVATDIEAAAEELAKTHSMLSQHLVIEHFGPVNRIDPDDLEGVLSLPILRDIAALRVNLEREGVKIRDRLFNDTTEPPF